MSGRLRFKISISLDGYVAGPNQSVSEPLGAGGERLHDWVVALAVWRKSHGKEGGETGPSNDVVAESLVGIGATIMGRNMFGGHPGPWKADKPWTGWWGKSPPFHHPVFVLTHHAREPLVMEGGTTFHFVTDGIHAALERAAEAAKGRDIRLGGGVATIRQYLRAGLVDEMHLAIAPTLLGAGEHLFCGVDVLKLGYRCAEHVATGAATHVVLAKG